MIKYLTEAILEWCIVVNIKNIVKKPIILSIMVVFIWAYLSVVVTMLGNIPPFEVLCFSTTIGFVITSIQLTMQKNWKLIKAPAEMWVIGTLFLFGSSVFYISAFHFSPPVHAELINYTWPLLVVIGGTVFFKEKLMPRHMFGLALCVISLFALHFDQLQSTGGVTFKHMYGYASALMGAISYSIYVLVSKKHNTVPSQIVGMYAGIGSVLALTGHLLFEKTIVPSQSELMLLLLLGASSYCFAYQVWDHAIKKLEAWKICVISYFTPVLSVILLTLSDFGVFSWPVVASCGLLFIGSILASIKSKERP
jgi:drug/metabolite transporter (DMT)-like permease